MDQSDIFRIAIEGGAVVFRKHPSVVIVLNDVAAFALERYLDGLSRHAIVTQLGERFPDLGTDDIELALDDGLLSLEGLSVSVGSTAAASSFFSDVADWHVDRIVKLGTSAIRLQIACDHFDDLILPIYGPAMDVGFEDRAIEFQLQVAVLEGHYWLKRHHLGCERFTPDVTGPFNRHGAFLEIQRHLLSTAHSPRQTHLILHAGAVLDEASETSIVLAGASGSGKSSLISAFLLDGYGFVADDTAIVDAETHELWCLRLPLRLKAGTWRHVQAQAPAAFSSWEPMTEPDGRKVWQLHPKRAANKNSPLAPPAAVVLFPLYEPGAATDIVKIDTLPALALMIESGAWFDTDERAMADTIGWLSRTPCYSVIYSSAGEIVAAVRDRLGFNGASGF